MTYVAKANGIQTSSATIQQGFGLNSVLFQNIVFDTFPKFGTEVGSFVHTSGVHNGNIITREAGIHRFKAQIYTTSPAGGLTASVYLALYSKGLSGQENVQIQVANVVVPSGQHPSLSLDTMVQAQAGEYFSFVWYFLNSKMSSLSLQTVPIYCFAEVEKLT